MRCPEVVNRTAYDLNLRTGRPPGCGLAVCAPSRENETVHFPLAGADEAARAIRG